MSNVKLDENPIQGDSVSRILDSVMDAGDGLSHLTPTSVPGSLLHPGPRIKLHPRDYFGFGPSRGGIDERCFGSTNEAAIEGRVWRTGLSSFWFEQSNELEPFRNKQRSDDGYEHRCIVDETVNGDQLLSAKELNIHAGARCMLQDPATSSWITVQEGGHVGKLDRHTQVMIRFSADITDEVFVSHTTATAGVEIENTGTEPLVGLKNFGPETHADFPKAGS